MRVLTICGSKKGEGGLMARPSAARSLLGIAEEGLRRESIEPARVDFCALDLPLFEGVPLSSYSQADVAAFSRQIADYPAFILSAPAYWGGPSGLVKNFLDLLGGPAYAHDEAQTSPFDGKRVALIAIGAAWGDAARASEQLQYALDRMGARVAQSPLCLDDPRRHDPQKMATAAFNFGRAFAKELQNG